MTSRGMESTYLVGRRATYEWKDAKEGSKVIGSNNDWQHVLQIIDQQKLIQNTTTDMYSAEMYSKWNEAMRKCVCSSSSSSSELLSTVTDVSMMMETERMQVAPVTSWEEDKKRGHAAAAAAAAAAVVVVDAGVHVVDLHHLSNPLHCRIVGSSIAEDRKWSKEMIIFIRNRIILRVFNKLKKKEACCMLYESLDIVFDLMTSKAAKKIQKKLLREKEKEK